MTIQTRQMVKALVRRVSSLPFQVAPEGRLKFMLRSAVAATMARVPPEFLVNRGETVVIIGFHRIDSVMLWSDLVGKRGRVVLIEAVPDYVQNIKTNLEHHLNWPLQNILYVNRAVAAARGTCRIQIGKRADFNKLAGQSIDDGLSAADFVQGVEVQADTIDQILADNGIDTVDHVHMTVSGMELEALRGMPRTLQQPALRVHIRSLHSKDGQLLYPQVVELLEQHGMQVSVGRASGRFKGRDIYGVKLPR